MCICKKNIFSEMPSGLKEEHLLDILKHKNVRIERIVSKGHISPDKGWYDQDENEWVIVLEGAGVILFEKGGEIMLKPGDYLDIPAHTKHRVTWTNADSETVWLAVFYK